MANIVAVMAIVWLVSACIVALDSLDRRNSTPFWFLAVLLLGIIGIFMYIPHRARSKKELPE